MNAAAAHAFDPDEQLTLEKLPDRPLTVEDLESFPRESGHRLELQDGVLIVSPAPSTRHQVVSFNIIARLLPLLPEEWTVAFAPGFAPRSGQYREPDAMVCLASAVRMGQNYPRPDEILMMVEVVSPSTITTDRVTKPIEYASHGIPWYLRVELNESGRVVKLFLHENIENPHREFESDPERVFHQIAETMTGGAPLPLPKPFTGFLDPNGL
jgi:Uma2 family endonuclease